MDNDIQNPQMPLENDYSWEFTGGVNDEENFPEIESSYDHLLKNNYYYNEKLYEMETKKVYNENIVYNEDDEQDKLISAACKALKL